MPLHREKTVAPVFLSGQVPGGSSSGCFQLLSVTAGQTLLLPVC